MLVSCEQMSEAERRFFATGVSPEPYMDEAGRLCAAAILRFFPVPGHASIFCGKGNNAGDALVVARWLRRARWKVTLHLCHDGSGLSPLAARKLHEFHAEPETVSDFPSASAGNIIVDGLLGIGAKGDLQGEVRAMAAKLNAQRKDTSASCIAIDIPTGLDADTGIPREGAVIADITLSITAPKTGFAADEAINHVGRLVEIPLAIPVKGGDASRRFLFPSSLRPRLGRRDYDTHKGSAGRVTIVAGSRGMTGAAVLCALGASRGGAGLVTVFVSESLYPLVAAQCPPEVMVKPYHHPDEVSALPADVIAVGPGLGREIGQGILDLLLTDTRPVVIDADALNALSQRRPLLSSLPPNRLLTPHPGEMARLVDLGEKTNRCTVARQVANDLGLTVLYKGARTVIASPQKPVELNTTGHPGMASGGMGDVLTGLCAALIAQGVEIHDSACIGSWMLGRAAELAIIDEKLAGESIHAPLVAEYLGMALRDLQTPGSP